MEVILRTNKLWPPKLALSNLINFSIIHDITFSHMFHNLSHDAGCTERRLVSLEVLASDMQAVRWRLASVAYFYLALSTLLTIIVY